MAPGFLIGVALPAVTLEDGLDIANKVDFLSCRCRQLAFINLDGQPNRNRPEQKQDCARTQAQQMPLGTERAAADVVESVVHDKSVAQANINVRTMHGSMTAGRPT